MKLFPKCPFTVMTIKEFINANLPLDMHERVALLREKRDRRHRERVERELQQHRPFWSVR
jgi:hypothetical protein